jgi:hypothetical protein
MEVIKMNEILEIIPCICFGLPCVVMIIFVVGGFMSDAKNTKIAKIGNMLLSLISD